MKKEGRNYVFIACSLDGFIADEQGRINWLQLVPNPGQNDMGYNAFINKVDAILLGRNTFETVLGFGIDWPYAKPVFVASNTLTSLPDELAGQVEVIHGSVKEIIGKIHEKGYMNLYIDGGNLIQSFLAQDCIDEFTVSRIPVLLGGGTPLFGKLPEKHIFEHQITTVFLGQIVQSTYIRRK